MHKLIALAFTVVFCSSLHSASPTVSQVPAEPGDDHAPQDRSSQPGSTEYTSSSQPSGGYSSSKIEVGGKVDADAWAKCFKGNFCDASWEKTSDGYRYIPPEELSGWDKKDRVVIRYNTENRAYNYYRWKDVAENKNWPLLAGTTIGGLQLGYTGDKAYGYYQLQPDGNWSYTQPQRGDVIGYVQLDKFGRKLFNPSREISWATGNQFATIQSGGNDFQGQQVASSGRRGGFFRRLFGRAQNDFPLFQHLFFLAEAHAEGKKELPKTEREAKKFLFVYNDAEKSVEYADEKAKVQLKNRVYYRYVKALDSWGYLLTDPFGRFDTPPGVLGTGSVVDGAALGAKDPNKKFKLTAEGEWEPVGDEEEVVIVWTNFEPVKLHLVKLVPSPAKPPSPKTSPS